MAIDQGTPSPDLFPCGCLITGEGSDQKRREVIYANRYAHDLLGLAPGSLKGQPIATLFTNASNIMIDSYVVPMLLHEGRCEDILLELNTPEGERIPVLLNAVRRDAGEPTIYWTLFRAVQRNQLYQELVNARHELQAKAEKLMELSIKDDLTGLLNRRELNRQADLLLAQAGRTGQPVSVLILDLDYFKNINDSLGHTAGDRILINLGELLRKEGRESDITARYGGDEFVIVMPDTLAAEARILAQRLAAKVSEIDSGEQPFSVSFGVSCSASGGPTSFEALFAKADREMYKAKALRRPG